MLRAAVTAETTIGIKAKSIMDEGGLVSDDIIIDLINERIKKIDCRGGFLFDGFPRTIAQAEALDKNKIIIDYVVEMTVSDEDIIERMSGRLAHLPSGRTYHVKHNPPMLDGRDDITGEDLVQRDDDKEETVRSRLNIYHEQTLPLVKYYQSQMDNSASITKLISVDATGTLEEVTNRIFTKLDI